LIFTGSFIAALSGALMPGPLLTITIAHAVKRGFWAGPLIVFGHMLLELSLISAILFGAEKYLLTPFVMKPVFSAGAVILTVMGFNLILKAGTVSVKESAAIKEKKNSGPVLSGALVSLANPYWTIWWLTIGLGYIIKAVRYGLAGIIIFFAGHILADLVWYSFVSLSFSSGKKFIGKKTYKTFIIVCGFFLVMFGIWFGLNGIRR